MLETGQQCESQINFAEYLTDYGDIAVEVRYGKELSRQSRAGLKEFCKRLLRNNINDKTKLDTQEVGDDRGQIG